jgi:hypothetical protein
MSNARCGGSSSRSRLVAATRKRRSNASRAVNSTMWLLPNPYSPMTARAAPPSPCACTSPSLRLARSFSRPIVNSRICWAGATPTRSASTSWRASNWEGGMGVGAKPGAAAIIDFSSDCCPLNSWRGRRKRRPFSKRTSHSAPLRYCATTCPCPYWGCSTV